jgi:hypothetical protein
VKGKSVPPAAIDTHRIQPKGFDQQPAALIGDFINDIGHKL